MSVEPTNFLYPFIDAGESDSTTLLADLATSANAKAAESRRLRDETLTRCRDEIEAIAAGMVERFASGGRLFTFGNGGSSTDAALLAALFAEPPFGRPLPARTLSSDEAVLTALGNDVGFELVFQRQLIAFAGPSDIAVGLSTSGNSDNLMCGFGEARRRGLLTIGFAGYDGGRMGQAGELDHCIVVKSESIHRIQETQDAVFFELWDIIQARLQPEGAV